MKLSAVHVASRGYDAIVHPAATPLQGRVVAQPSKNYTTRYLLAAALADGESLVQNCATSDDAVALQDCLRALGADLQVSPEPGLDGAARVRVVGVAGKPSLQKPGAALNPGNAGAVLRFLLAIGALLPDVEFVTDHHDSLGKRPNGDLLHALAQLGCETESGADGRLPIHLRGGNLQGVPVEISGGRSSQFLSGLLFLAPLVRPGFVIRVTNGLVSKAPVRQTLEVLAEFGVKTEASGNLLEFHTTPCSYRSGDYSVNGDWPGSAALLSAAAVTGGQVEIAELYRDEQGERAAGDVLGQMGAEFRFNAGGNGVAITGTGSLRGVDFDGDLATDAVLALMGAACFAEGRSRFYNVSNLRIKECDRISEPLAELRKLGVRCWEGNELGDSDPDAIIIDGNPDGYEGGVTVDGRGDHRVIMLLSVVALGCRKPVRISNAHFVAKSYPGYFEHLTQLGARVERIERGS